MTQRTLVVSITAGALITNTLLLTAIATRQPLFVYLTALGGVVVVWLLLWHTIREELHQLWIAAERRFWDVEPQARVCRLPLHVGDRVVYPREVEHFKIAEVGEVRVLFEADAGHRFPVPPEFAEECRRLARFF
jgi:hypothetical protein